MLRATVPLPRRPSADRALTLCSLPPQHLSSLILRNPSSPLLLLIAGEPLRDRWHLCRRHFFSAAAASPPSVTHPPMDATLKSFLAAAFYAFVSTSITFFNKAVLASYAFQWPNLMTLVQMLCSILFLVMLRAVGLIQYPKPTWVMAKKIAPLSIAFMAMVLTGLGALKSHHNAQHEAQRVNGSAGEQLRVPLTR